jgi:predicted porin
METAVKKKLLGLVVLGAVTALAHAQSSVQLYGTVDGGVRYQTNANAAGDSLTTPSSNGFYSSNKLDIGGSEDLGGGLNAHFLLESGFNLANGQLDNTTDTEFNRQAYMGVGGAFGTIDLGRQYTIAHDVIYAYDPFHFHYTPILPLTLAADGTRFNNDIKYKGGLGPIKVELDNSVGGNAGNFSQAAARGAGLQYEAGPFSVGGVYSHRNSLVGSTYRGDKYYMFGGAYRIGPVSLSGGFMSEDQAAALSSQDLVTRNLFGGASYKINSFMTLTAGYYQTSIATDAAAKRALSIIGLSYALSKRTVLYSEVDYTKYKNAVVSTLNTTGKSSQTAFTAGLDHSF